MGKSQSVPVPEEMIAAQLSAPGKPIDIVTVPTPVPRSGQVLIAVHCSPINPSDLDHIDGRYGKTHKYPSRAGFEGSGVVVRSGGGFMANRLVGKRVSFFTEEPGAWAQYVVAKAMDCLDMDANETFEEAAMFVVNPVTALMFIEVVKKSGSRAVVQTAAASALARMFARLCAEENIRVINVVRKKEHVEMLRTQDNQALVLNSAEPDYEESLAQMIKITGARVCFDPISGESILQIMKHMPPRSEGYIYGQLAGGKAELDCAQLLFNGHKLSGFHAGNYHDDMSLWAQIKLIYRLNKQKKRKIFRTTVRKTYPIEQANSAIQEYRTNMTGGKSMFVIHK